MITFPKLKDVLACREILFGLRHNELPYKTAIKINRFLDGTSIINADYNEVEQKLAEECFLRDENGKPVEDEHGIKFDETKESWFREKMDELLESNIKYMFDRDNYFTDEDLACINLMPFQLDFMKWMIIDTESGGE